MNFWRNLTRIGWDLPSLRRVGVLEWVLLLLALLVLTAALLVPAFQERGDIVTRERSRLAATALVIEQNVAHILGGANRAIAEVRDEWLSLRNRDDGAAVASRRLKAFADAIPGVRSMFVVDAQGRVPAFGAIDSVRLPPGLVVSDLPYFQTVHRQPDATTLYVSAPFVTRAGAWAFNVSRALVGPNGEFQGLIVATIDLDEVRLLLASARYVDDQFCSIVHGAGAEIVIEPPRMGAQGRNLAQPGTLFARHLASGQADSVQQGVSSVSGKERLLAFRTLQPPALHMDQPVVVVVGREMAALLSPWRALIAWRLALVAVLWALAVPGLWVWQRVRWRVRVEALARVRQIDQVFDSSLSLLAIFDAKGHVIRLSTAWHKVMGWPIEQQVGRRVMLVWGHPDDHEKVRDVQRKLDQTGVAQDFQYRLRDTQGAYHEFLMQAVVLNGLSYVDARDVTRELQDQQALQELNNRLQASNEQLKAHEALLLQMTQRDELTQLANRRRFDEQLDKEWRRSTREGLPLAVVMIDVDHFKAYNDHYGHPAGDACLRSVAEAMQRCLGRPHDLLARYGGEEFILLLPHTPAKGALKVAEKLRQAVEALDHPHERSPTGPRVTVSVGVAALVPVESMASSALVTAADQALYQAKTQGRNRVCTA